VILPGYCRGDITLLEMKLGVPVVMGPRDFHDLPEFFGRSGATGDEGDQPLQPALEIIAEINHVASMSIEAIMSTALELVSQGADVIDLGCEPAADRPVWPQLATAVRELVRAGVRVSVDSFQPEEVAAACEAGAELVLSVNTSNAHLARQWHGAQVVAIPDDPHTLAGLDRTIQQLSHDGVAFRIDPVLEPINFGFAASLGRYLQVRRQYPDTPMMMGVGNLTEMTEVDSAGVNMLLTGFCIEQGIDSVLTTQVINWARQSVREIDIARRLIQRARKQGRPPKHVDPSLVMLRDEKFRVTPPDELAQLASSLTDANIRLFAQQGQLHAMNRDFHVTGSDPFVLFDEMKIDDPSHAFYLGYEMAKAVTALTLGKNYTQDQALNWGMNTQQETSHHERRKRQRKSSAGGLKKGGEHE
jgi:dihydropteroate synthase